MFLVKSGTIIQVETPKSETHFYWSGWMPYTTKEDKIYDTHSIVTGKQIGRAHV